MERIIGIDIGLRNTGYGIIDFDQKSEKIIEGGVIKTDSKENLDERLLTIFNDLDYIYKKYAPKYSSMEDLHSRYRNLKTSIIMGHARGVACAVSALNKVPVYHYQPTQIKNIISGSGRADKNQMIKTIANRLNSPAITNEHVADAFATSICHWVMFSSIKKV